MSSLSPKPLVQCDPVSIFEVGRLLCCVAVRVHAVVVEQMGCADGDSLE